MLSKEETANGISHLIGLLFCIIGTGNLIYLGFHFSILKIASLTVYGISLILLYGFSTLYHFSEHNTKANFIFQKLDHAAIFLLIAGTYTPLMVLGVGGKLCMFVLTIVWFLAILGVFLETTGFVKEKAFFLSLYIIMGWLAVFFMKQIIEAIPTNSLIMLIAGGVFYTLGVFFYVRKKMTYSHVIWHVFVLAGSTFHYFSILYLL